MPQIPQYESNRGIQPGSVPQINQQSSGQSVAQREAIVAIEQAEETARNIRNFRQSSEASLYAFDRLQEQVSLADQDINFDSTPYDSAIDKIGQEAAKTIASPAERDRFLANFQRQAIATKWKIKSDFRTKELSSLDATISLQGQQIIDTYGSMDEATKITSLDNYKKQFNEAIRVGLYDKPTADQKWLSFQKKLNVGQVQWDIYNDNSTKEDESPVLAELRKGSEGNYDFLSSSDRLELIKESQRRIFQNNQTFKREAEEIQNTRTNDIYTKLAEGTATLNDIEKEKGIPEDQGGIPIKQLLNIQEGMVRRIKTDLEVITEDNDKAADYLKFIDSYIADETDRQRSREYLASAYKNNILSPKEAIVLNKIKGFANDIRWNNMNFMFKNAVKVMRDKLFSRKNASDSDIALSIKQLLDGLSEETDIPTVTNKILNEHAVNANPIISTFNADGETTMDADGNIATMKPDGSYKE